MVRCDVAICTQASGTGLTFIQERTSLATLTPGRTHTLQLSWSPTTRVVAFQLDGNPPAEVDLSAVNDAGAPHKPFWQVSTHAGASGPGVDFTTGSEASIRARFDDVKGP